MAARSRRDHASQQDAEKREQLLLFLEEANQVVAITGTEGWRILARDILADRERISKLWPRVRPGSKEYDQLRMHALTNERILELIEDYKTNRQMALAELAKMERSVEEIAMDVDNESPLEEEAVA